MLSQEAQIELEAGLKRLRHGYTCNIHRLNRWTAHLELRAGDEDVNDVGRPAIGELLGSVADAVGRRVRRPANV